MSLRIFAHHQNYRSHHRAAQGYIDIFARMPEEFVQIVDDPDQANVSYLHTEADRIADILNDYPSLKTTYKIGFCVWETDIIPPDYASSLTLVDEVWTASYYNWISLSKIHPRVRWVPHVTGGLHVATRADVDEFKEKLRIEPDDFCYLFIGKDEPRKNVQSLVQAFDYVNQRHPNTRLLVKTQGESNAQLVVFEGRVARCYGSYTASQIAALYDMCHVYVSPHRSEGWGLTLSDAMGYRRLCVATGYSGNLDYMTEHNSLLVKYSLVPVQAEHRHRLMREGMSWAYPHPESLEHQMLCAYALIESGEAQTRIEQAARDIRCFDARHIRVLVRHHLRRIAQRLCG